MSSIPYNYGSYIDAKVAMTDTGHVSAGKQIQSPASAGSRGLAKTTQFTNDKTQMQLGQEAIAESMVEIRSILNRIDGVNAPVQEDAGDEAMAKEIAELYDNVLEWITDTENAETDDEAEYGDGYTDTDYNDATDLAKTFREKGMQAGLKLHKELLAKRKGDGFSSFSEWDPLSPETELNYAAKKILARQKESAVQEDDMRDMTISDLEAQLGKINDEITFLQIDQKDKESALAALGELRSVLDKYQSQKESAVQEDAGEKIANMAQNMTKDQFMGHADELGLTPEEAAEHYEKMQGGAHVQEKQSPYTTDKAGAGYIMANKDKIIQQLYAGGVQSVLDPKDAVKAISDLIPDVTEKEIIDIIKKDNAFAGESAVQEDIGDKGRIALEKAGFDPMKVKEYMAVFNDHGDTSDIDQMNMDKVGLADAMAMVLASHDVENESYQPMPEGDEFDIEEDEDFEEVLGPLGFPEDETELFDAEYQGRKVPLNKPMRGDTKKFKVYVKDPKTGNVKKVNFGHGGTSAKRKTMRIRKSNPKARKSFRARHNCANPGPKTKARYWSCRKW